MKRLYRQSLRKFLFEEVQLKARAERISKDGYCLLKDVHIVCSEEEAKLDHMWVDSRLVKQEHIGKEILMFGTVKYYLKKNGSYSYGVMPEEIRKL